MHYTKHLLSSGVLVVLTLARSASAGHVSGHEEPPPPLAAKWEYAAPGSKSGSGTLSLLPGLLPDNRATYIYSGTTVNPDSTIASWFTGVEFNLGKQWSFGVSTYGNLSASAHGGFVSSQVDIGVQDTVYLKHVGDSPIHPALPAFLNVQLQVDGTHDAHLEYTEEDETPGPGEGSNINSQAGLTLVIGADVYTSSLFDGGYGLFGDPNFFVTPAIEIPLHGDSNGNPVGYSLGLGLRIGGRTDQGRYRADSSKTVKITSITLPDGRTPEEAGYELTFESGFLSPNISITPVPEPSSIALLGMGSLGLCGYRWRRKRQCAS